MTAKHTTRPELIQAAERRAYVLEQRKGGLTYREIAAATIKKFTLEKLPKGYDERIAWMDVKAELTRIQESNKEEAQEIRSLELARLDRMQTAIWQNVLSGHEGAIDRVLRIMQRRADLLGLDAPKKQDWTSKGESMTSLVTVYIPENKRDDNNGK